MDIRWDEGAQALCLVSVLSNTDWPIPLQTEAVRGVARRTWMSPMFSNKIPHIHALSYVLSERK